MMWTYAPPWGIRAVAAVGTALLTLALLRALRELRNVRLRRQALALGLRLLALAALVAILLNPTALIPQEFPGKARLVVLLDTSASMATRDVAGKPRLEAALDALRARGVLARLEDAFSLDVRTFDKGWRPASLGSLAPQQATGKASDIAGALVGALGDASEPRGQAGVLLVSDGRATTEGGPDAARLALARSVPLWAWCLGGAVERRDLWLEAPASEVLAFAGAEVELAATLRQVGYPGRSFRVELVQDGKVLDTREALPDATGAARVVSRVTAPASGEHRYAFRVPAEKDEADSANNERPVFLRVVGGKVRVLVAEGQPHWDTKFLVQALKRDPRVDLTAVYRFSPKRMFAVLSSEGKQRREAGDFFPRTAEAMGAFDIVAFGRGSEAFFDAGTEELVADFVGRRGGGVIFARGKPYSGRFLPLARLEPVVWGDGLAEELRLRVTDAGRESPVFELGAAASLDEVLSRLPAFDRATSTVGEKPLAVVLATAEEKGTFSFSAQQPSAPQGGEKVNVPFSSAPIVMAYQRYGQGKVVTVNASGLWRWGFREKADDEQEQVYTRFWASLLRWMLAGADFLPGADVALRSERRQYTDEQPFRFLLTTRGLDREAYRPRLTIQGPAEPVEVEPRAGRGGVYLAEAGPFPEGTYRVTLRNNIGSPPELTTTVEAVSSSVENRVLSADPEAMRRLAELSDGQALSASEVGDLPGIIRRWRAARQVTSEKSSLWDRWWLLAGVLAALGIEWLLRRREGLL